jgi:hypothetical protein
LAKINASRYADAAGAQSSYLAKVDAFIESRRSIPAAKADAYRAKYDDACGIMAGNQSTGWVSTEASEAGVSEQAVAESIIAARIKQDAVSAKIEAKRTAAKNSIRQASSVREMHNILESLKVSL